VKGREGKRRERGKGKGSRVPQPLQSYVHVCRCQQSEDLLYAAATGSYCSDLESRHDSRLLLRQLMDVSVSQKFIAFYAKY